MLKVKSVLPLKDYKLKVIFDNDVEKICDINQYLNDGDFTELKDIQLFNQVKCIGYYVEWPNELDLSADTLRLM